MLSVADGGKPKNPPIQAAISIIKHHGTTILRRYFVDFNKVVHDIT
jgi:hypothetical protein